MFLGAFTKLRKANFDQVVLCGLTDMTKLTVAFRNAGNALKRRNTVNNQRLKKSYQEPVDENDNSEGK
jgi:hypothetical protein